MSRVFKRSINFSVAAVGLVLVGPVALCLALLIYLVDGRPVLVLDPWIDRRGKSIMLTAFRTHRGQAFSRGRRSASAVGGEVSATGWAGETAQALGHPVWLLRAGRSMAMTQRGAQERPYSVTSQ